MLLLKGCAVLQDPAAEQEAWSLLGDTPKPWQEPTNGFPHAIPQRLPSPELLPQQHSSKANWAEELDPSASCLQELPASLHGCCQHGPGLAKSSICTRMGQARLCWQGERLGRATVTLELLKHNPWGA